MDASPSIARPRSRRSILDSMIGMRQRGYLGFFEQIWREDGDLAKLEFGKTSVFLVTHPRHVRHITVQRERYDKAASYDSVRALLLGNGLVTSTGALWRRQRKLIAPFFTPRAIEQFMPVILEEALAFRADWSQKATQRTPVDMLTEMTNLTGRIILRALFSTKSERDLTEIKHAVELMIGFSSGRQMQMIAAPLWLPTPANRAYYAARALVTKYISQIIDQRRAMPEAEWPRDLLSTMMLARDEETGQPMADALLHDEAVTLFFAGHETTARTLSFMWYALDQHPEVAARLHAELDSVLGDAPPTVAQLKQLPYALQVIKETLRLYPSAPVYVRDAVVDDVIDGQPIPKGARMMMLPYLTHRHPDFWPNPDHFDPDRWTPEQETARDDYAYHPFAAGQRVCIGNHFALFETHLLVAILARQFAPKLKPGHTPHWAMQGTLTVTNGLPMTIVERQSEGLGARS